MQPRESRVITKNENSEPQEQQQEVSEQNEILAPVKTPSTKKEKSKKPKTKKPKI